MFTAIAHWKYIKDQRMEIQIAKNLSITVK